MKSFKFQWKRRLFWHTKTIVGFGLDKDLDRMQIFFENGTTLEISKWSKCDCLLGSDYFKIKHKMMEEKAGQSIPVKATI